ncbi:uncharacterized protein [Amphiura filiformis]|uniref:uncharacterized protein n=1 Tax=Amphiura filiformis TaxID=82378 RepID=UPI003B219E38
MMVEEYFKNKGFQAIFVVTEVFTHQANISKPLFEKMGYEYCDKNVQPQGATMLRTSPLPPALNISLQGYEKYYFKPPPKEEWKEFFAAHNIETDVEISDSEFAGTIPDYAIDLLGVIAWMRKTL